MNKYNKDTVFNEFRHCDASEFFIGVLNLVYDDVKKLSIAEIESLLPTTAKTGFNGTYFVKDYMIHEIKSIKFYPFTLEGKIFDWFGDKTTCDIICAAANSELELYQRLLVQYLTYLIHYMKYEKAAAEFSELSKKIHNFIKVKEQYGT